jgi:hypothetical protein
MHDSLQTNTRWMIWLVLGLCLLYMPTTVQSQSEVPSQSEHDVRVSIPEILSLELEGASGTNETRVRLDITVNQDNSATITPASSSLRIVANTAWQLSASYLASDPRLQLTWHLDNGASQRLSASPQPLLLGDSLSAKNLTFIYGLAQPLPEGNYYALVTYTLTRP